MQKHQKCEFSVSPLFGFSLILPVEEIDTVPGVSKIPIQPTLGKYVPVTELSSPPSPPAESHAPPIRVLFWYSTPSPPLFITQHQLPGRATRALAGAIPTYYLRVGSAVLMLFYSMVREGAIAQRRFALHHTA